MPNKREEITCPVCKAKGSIGLLQKTRRGDSVSLRYFCNNCCTEVCYVDQRLAYVLSINEEGEAVPVAWPALTAS